MSHPFSYLAQLAILEYTLTLNINFYQKFEAEPVKLILMTITPQIDV